MAAPSSRPAGGVGSPLAQPRRKPAPSSSTGGRGTEATRLLEQDHDNVKKLFQEFESTVDGDRRQEVFRNIKNELEVHTSLEEEIFYRELERLGDSELRDQLREAHQDHDEVKRMLGRAEGLEGDSAELEELVNELRESVEHHVQEEEGEMFPRVRRVCSPAELRDMGSRMQQRQKALVEEGTREMVEV